MTPRKEVPDSNCCSFLSLPQVLLHRKWVRVISLSRYCFVLFSWCFHNHCSHQAAFFIYLFVCLFSCLLNAIVYRNWRRLTTPFLAYWLFYRMKNKTNTTNKICKGNFMTISLPLILLLNAAAFRATFTEVFNLLI